MVLSDLKFDPGLEFESRVWKFFVLVNFLDSHNLREFFLAAEFLRSKICLNADFVGLIPQSCARYNVSLLQNWTFKFSVSSKDVGLSIMGVTLLMIPLICIFGFRGLEVPILRNLSYIRRNKKMNGSLFLYTQKSDDFFS